MKNEASVINNLAAPSTISLEDFRPGISLRLEPELAEPFVVAVRRDLPESVERSYFNLGAVLLAPIWLFAHGLRRQALIGTALVALFSLTLHWMAPINGYETALWLVVMILPTVHRDAEAWLRGTYDNAEEYFARQRIWTVFGVVTWLGILSVVLIHAQRISGI